MSFKRRTFPVLIALWPQERILFLYSVRNGKVSLIGFIHKVSLLSVPNIAKLLIQFKAILFTI